MISVIIPTYQEPEYLDLCLKSCIEGQTQKNEIIVVVDGFYDINKEVLDKWGSQILIVDLPENVGLSRATNMGVYNATNEWILVVNDDNVFQKGWDANLEQLTQYNKSVFSLNQVEPNPSIFSQFIIKDYGKNASEFDLKTFWDDFERPRDYFDASGGTLPFFITKNNYLSVGGWDENYPTNGVVADWDFFCKCETIGLTLSRSYNTSFYHFAQVATGTQRHISEQQGHEYFLYKWRKSYIPAALRK